MKKGKEREFRFGELSGGVDLTDSIDSISSDKLSFCNNMWFKNGSLTTRPSVLTNVNMVSAMQTEPDADTHLFREVSFNQDGEEFRLCAVMKNLNSSGLYTLTDFFWVGSRRIIALPTLPTPDGISELFVFLHKAMLYCFASNQNIYKLDLSIDYPSWLFVDDDDIYTPTIATNIPYYAGSAYTPDEVFRNAVRKEGINIISRRVRLLYNSVNREYLKENDYEEHSMIYCIPYGGAVPELIPDLLEVYLLDPAGFKVQHTFRPTEHSSYFREHTYREDGLSAGIHVNGDTLLLYFYDSEETIARRTADEFRENDLEVIVPKQREGLERVFSMTKTKWFGGASAGVSGGTRLFLGGSTNENEKNLVIWSGLDNPLYFPEYNYFYVGDSMSGVTCFGRQSDMLVIFKENETFFTRCLYASSSNIGESYFGAEEYDDARSFFPLIPINTNIGCDLPDTIELCRNRLVWATSTGKVYTLTSNEQYNERSIFEVGSKIEVSLKNDITKESTACGFEGYYLLKAGERLYLMDYNCEGYSSAGEYEGRFDATSRIPWYIWDIKTANLKRARFFKVNDTPVLFGFFPDVDNTLRMAVFYIATDENALGQDSAIRLTDGSYEVVNEPIVCSFKTSASGLSLPDEKKRINKVGLTLGSRTGSTLSIGITTENASHLESVPIITDGTDDRHISYMKNILIRPGLCPASTVMLSAECEGIMSIKDIAVYYVR